MLVFGSLIFYSYYRDKGFLEQENNYIKIVSYILIYTSLSYFVFGTYGNDYITMENFQIFVFIMYMISAFAFNYRMIIVNNIIFLLFFGIFTVPNVSEEAMLNTIIMNSIYLVALSSIASLVKNVLIDRDSNYHDLEKARDNLEKIILSSNNLLNVEDKLPDTVQETHISYLRDMFELACNIYPKFTKATCNIKLGKYVKFIAAKSFDIEYLDSLEFLSEEFAWTLEEPEIVKNTDYSVVFEDTSNWTEFEERYGILKESIRFTVVFDEENLAGMSFDLFVGDTETFNEYDLENFKSFQKLMNSHAKVNLLYTEKNNLKDSLVLSLVRTLELYDSYTGGHSEEVAELSLALGKKL